MKSQNKTLSFLSHAGCKIALAVLSVLCPIKLDALPYQLRDFQVELAQPYVYSIAQDSLGYLWISTGNGLTRYDGFSFQHFTINDSLADNFISCSYSRGNELWLGHRNGKISYYNGRFFTVLHAKNQQTAITEIKRSPGGQLWAGTFQLGLVKIGSHALETAMLSDKNPITIYSFEFIEENKIIAGTDLGVIICKLQNNGSIEIIEQLPEIPKDKIPSLIKMKQDSGFYVATENSGIYKIELNNNQFTVVPLSGTTTLITSTLQQIIEDSHQNLWVASFGQGLIRISFTPDESTPDFTYFNKKTGFSTDYIKSILEDREGNIWSGNYGSGLTQITRRAFTKYKLPEPLSESLISAITGDKKYRWVATGSQLLKYANNSDSLIKSYGEAMELTGNRITALFSSDSNSLWIGTYKNGLYRLNPASDRITPYFFASGQLENTITALSGNKNQLWVGTQKGVCHINPDTGTSRWYTIADGLPHNVINHLLLDSKNQVWIASVSNILVCIKNRSLYKFPILSEDGVASLGPIAETKDSTIWVGSQGGGIFRIQNDSIAGISVQEGLLSNYVYSLVADSNNFLWAGHRGGISKINLNNLLVKPLQLYAGIPGNCNFIENAIYKDDRNQIWFGSNQGLWYYNPEKEDQALVAPFLNITSVKINDNEVDYTESIVLRPGIYNVKIEFIGVHLSEPKHVLYQYQMLGYDMEPEQTKFRSVNYPRLSDGTYTFELFASTGDGVVTPTPITLELIIRKPLWKYIWFWVIIALVVSSAVYLYIKRSEYTHQIEKDVLEAKVTARTLELEQKNHLLNEKQKQISEQNQELVKYRNYLEQLVDERTKELLIAKNKAEESDRLKTAFLNNISHEFRTPLNAVCGFSKLMAEPKFDQNQLSEFVQIINNNSDTLLQMLDEIIEISLIESNQDLVTDTSFNLHQLMLEIEKQYQINNTKNITITYTNKTEAEPIELNFNRIRFRQIFANLLFNAYKFTEHGKINFGFEKFKNQLRFFVADTGIGIKESELERIFEPFYKIENTDDKLYRGTGIGLTLCRKIVTQMGGNIWVDSVLNQGTICYFTLPMTNKAEQT